MGKVYTVFCQNGVLGDVLEQTFSKATLSAPTTEKLTKADSSVVADNSLELKPYYIEVKGKTIQHFKDTLLSLITSHQSAGKIVVQISTDLDVFWRIGVTLMDFLVVAVQLLLRLVPYMPLDMYTVAFMGTMQRNISLLLGVKHIVI